ncbi:hypothetical protein LINGRAHAP2_LOCUS7137 [Linum grandiflorum]
MGCRKAILRLRLQHMYRWQAVPSLHAGGVAELIEAWLLFTPKTNW